MFIIKDVSFKMRENVKIKIKSQALTALFYGFFFNDNFKYHTHLILYVVL